jgi:nicotinate-nucleotide--dimethylbenzimidazole phosphoribosyltransferase
MSFDGWRTALVLGGSRSGRSAFAESLLAGAAAPHRLTVDPADPGRLVALIVEAKPDEVLLVDDLEGWVRAHLERDPAALPAAVADLADAVRTCAGRLVIVSPEADLPLPPDATDPVFADEIGRANLALADACDGVVLVVAGQPAWLKRRTPAGAARATPPAGGGAAQVVEAAEPPSDEPPRAVPPAALPPVVTPPPRPAETAPTRPEEQGPPQVAADVLTAPTVPLSALTAGLVIQPGMDLPLPDEEVAERARARLRRLDVPRGGLGALADVVAFAAATQGLTVPRPWQSVRVLLVHGDHDGGAGAGDSPQEAARRAREAADGEGPLGTLIAEAGAGLQVVPAPTAGPIETADALTAVEVDEALRYGWRLAEDAADSGVDLLVIAACGAGTDAAAAAVTAVLTGAEPVALLSRVDAPGGRYDDAAWMTRCATVRDALHRTRGRSRGAHDVLAALGGGDLAVVTGVLLGAASRRTPVLLDGPVGVAAAVVSRELGGQARHWCLLPDHNGHPTVRYAAEVLGLRPVLDLRLGLGEGASALAALPLLRGALTVTASLPEHPALRVGPDAGAGATGDADAHTDGHTDSDAVADTDVVADTGAHAEADAASAEADPTPGSP